MAGVGVVPDPGGDGVAGAVHAEHDPAAAEVQVGGEGHRGAPAAAGRPYRGLHDVVTCGRAADSAAPDRDHVPVRAQRHSRVLPAMRLGAAQAEVCRLPCLPVRAGAHLHVRGAVSGGEGPAGRHGPGLVHRHRTAARPRQLDRARPRARQRRQRGRTPNAIRPASDAKATRPIHLVNVARLSMLHAVLPDT